jgi:hypothetical protein
LPHAGPERAETTLRAPKAGAQAVAHTEFDEGATCSDAAGVGHSATSFQYAGSVIHPDFQALLDPLPAACERLREMAPVTIATLPPKSQMPASGIYWLTEGGASIYVGRSRRIRDRLKDHVRPSSDHNKASFAFRLAREMTGNLVPTYRPNGSRSKLQENPQFAEAFAAAKERIRNMHVRFVGEDHSVRQCLLEVYVATAVGARYNDFDSH